MAEAKLLEVLKITDQAIQSNRSTSVKVCVNQCNILRAAFGHAHDFFSKLHDLKLVSSKETVSLVWDEALGVMRKGLELLKSCEEGNWIIRTLLCEESREHFQNIFGELYSCIELVSVRLFQLASTDLQRGRISEAYNTCFMRKNSFSMMEFAAVNDRKQMVRVALAQEEVLESKQSLSHNDQALQMLCTMFLEKSPDGRFALDHKQLSFKTHIGHGAFGTVYEATWLGHTFAVKVFSPGDTSFPRELAVLTSYKHPNILHIVGHSYDSEKHQYSLVMERMEMDLADYILRNSSKKNKPLPLAVSLSILLQVSTAMAWLHSKNVIHRDLKPQNVLVSTSSKGDQQQISVRIADFGLARTDFITSLISGATSRRGTKHFMAPEVWNSETYSKKADVYSYAMVCFQVLTGVMPFKDVIERPDFMDLVCNGTRPVLPANLPSELAEVIGSCWSQNPNDRPQFSEVSERLKAVKARILTGTDLTEGRNRLLAFVGVTSSSPQLNPETSRTMVNLDSLVGKVRNMTTASPSSNSRRSSSTERSFAQAQEAKKVPSIRDELFEMMRKGLIKDAMDKALSLKDPSTVWWLCSKAEPSLLLAFNQPMVLSIAEQINNNFGVDTAVRLLWIDQAIQIATRVGSDWGSPRLERFFEQLSQNLHGQLAVTPRDAELALSLLQMLNGCNMWLGRVRTAISNNAYFGR